MSGILTYSLGILGLLGLFYGGNTLVKGTIKTANSLNLPAHLIAVTIVALGTSAPELVVSINAVLKNSPDLAWGNVVGSNIANLLLVLGGAALFLNLQDNMTGALAGASLKTYNNSKVRAGEKITNPKLIYTRINLQSRLKKG